MREKIGEVTLHLTINNQPLKSGKHTICLRVQHKNTNRYYSTHCEMSKEEWTLFEKSPDSDHPAMTTYRTFLNAIKSLVRDDAFSFANLSQATNRSRGNHIQEILLEHTLQLRRDGKHNTADMYNNLYVCVNEFLKGKPTPITSFGPDTCRSFVRWLTDKRHNNPTTVAIKMRNLTAVMNRAVEAKMITRNPMNGIRKPQPRRRDLSISPESLKKILFAGPSDLPEDTYFWLLHWRALYYGNGMNARDLLRIKRSDVRNGEIVFTRHKTEESSGKIVHVALIPQLYESLEPIAKGKRLLLPYLEGIKENSMEEHARIRQVVKNINMHMRAVSAILRIPEKVTTYTARHCFATVLQQKNVSIEFISNALGHSSIKTTQNYLDGYTNEQRVKNARLLTPQ